MNFQSQLQLQNRSIFLNSNFIDQTKAQPGYPNKIGQLVDDIQGVISEKTHLIQLYTDDPEEGPRLISEYHPVGTPIMVIVDPPSCCYFKLNVPHGIVSMEQKWGKFTNMMDPGYYCCYCSHKRIAAMITKNSIQFNTPIEACPTKDNVMVTVDISIQFHIGKDDTREEDCEKFVYYLGANKLEELLIQESEESIRVFVRQIKVNQIRDIKSELAHEMINELNRRFNMYGVYVESVSVSNVIVPRDLRIALQQATTYDVFLQNQLKIQENMRLKMMNENNKTLLQLKRENQKKLLELNNQFSMEEIYLQTFKVQSETDQQIQIIKAKQNQDIKIIQAEAIKEQAEARAKKLAEQIVAEAKAYSEGKMALSNARKKNSELLAQTRLQVARLRAQGLMLEADAEGAQAQNLESKRKHEQRMAQIAHYQQLMKDNKIIISGKNAEELLNYFKETGDLVNSNN